MNYYKGKEEKAKLILEKLYPAEEVEEEIQAMKTSAEQERSPDLGVFNKLIKALRNVVVRRGLYAGITAQVAQQFVGINAIMYYGPTIIQFAGYASHRTAMALSLITCGLNMIGSIISMCFVDRYGRRRLMILSMIGIICCLVVLSVIFFRASETAPKVSLIETAYFGPNATCQAYIEAPDASSWGCFRCLKRTNRCAFCSAPTNKVR